MVKKIMSGGQTGADRAALDFAIERSIPHGGWVPKGRKAEDGMVPARYQVTEMATTSYPKRTRRNVLDSDGTVIITLGKARGGSALTIRAADEFRRPRLHIELDKTDTDEAAKGLRTWVIENDISVLNIAGPRASEEPGIYGATKEVLEKALHWGAPKV